MPKKHSHVERDIVKHYRRNGQSVIFESKADIQGFDNHSSKVIGEFKGKEESSKPYSWWSDWKGRLSPHYGNAHQNISARARGWCAVIDGQLRDYCSLENVSRGELAVESFQGFSREILEALDFLKGMGRVSGYQPPVTDSTGIGYITIHYN